MDLRRNVRPDDKRNSYGAREGRRQNGELEARHPEKLLEDRLPTLMKLLPVRPLIERLPARREIGLRLRALVSKSRAIPLLVLCSMLRWTSLCRRFAHRDLRMAKSRE
jgi:hypothetical protein